MDGISQKDIMESLAMDKNIMNIFQSGEGIGKSGSFFFYTQDKKYVVKTTRRNEKAIVLGMLDEMVKHIENTNNESFLVRIYGIFTVKTSIFGTLLEKLRKNFNGFLFWIFRK